MAKDADDFCLTCGNNPNIVYGFFDEPWTFEEAYTDGAKYGFFLASAIWFGAVSTAFAILAYIGIF